MAENNQSQAESILSPSRQALEVTQDTLNRLFETAAVERVYGEPLQHGETVIIPAAEVLVGVGFGVGFGGGVGGSEEGGEGTGGGGGGGGGGRTLSRPVAVVVASPQGVHVEPVVDPTKIALAALTAGGFMIAAFMRMVRPKRALKEMRGG